MRREREREREGGRERGREGGREGGRERGRKKREGGGRGDTEEICTEEWMVNKRLTVFR